MRTVAVIPAYNESSTIGSVIDGTSRYVDEVVVVDDGSSDDTAAIAREHGAHVVTHVFNTGVGGAVRTGIVRNSARLRLRRAGRRRRPARPGAVRPCDHAEDADMVIGSRYLNESIDDYPLIRRRESPRVRPRDSAVSTLPTRPSGFRVYRVSALQDILHRSDNHWAVEQTLDAAQRGQRIADDVGDADRDEGESQFSLDTLVHYPLRMTDTVFASSSFANYGLWIRLLTG